MGDEITLSDGAGGQLMEELVKSIFLDGFTFKKALDGVGLEALDDGASLKVDGGEVVVSIDSHTVSPIFFPGGDIGRLAVAGTVNDVSVMGAMPIAILDAIVVEEGFSRSDLKRIVDSMDETAREVGVSIISGDFKVMPKGSLDSIVITTCGVGLAVNGVVTDAGAKPGDKVIVTGYVGDHGAALLSAREGIGFETSITSDVRPVWKAVEAALKVGGVHAMKDPTRGGLAQALNEIAEKSGVSIWVRESEIPVRDEVKGLSEVLGLSPYELLNEGMVIIIADANLASDILKGVRSTREGENARIIGEVKSEHPGKVFLETEVGGVRFLSKPVGEPLPRIC